MLPFACIFPCTCKFSPIVALFNIPIPPDVTIEPVILDELSVASFTLSIPADVVVPPIDAFPVIVAFLPTVKKPPTSLFPDIVEYPLK